MLDAAKAARYFVVCVQFEFDEGALVTTQKVEGQVSVIWSQTVIEPLEQAAVFEDLE
jgi:hypothetical protein